MAHRVEDWQDVLQQLMPRGKAWPRDQTAALTSLLRGFSSRLQLAEANADLLVTEMRPETTDLLLADWEDYLGLPDCNAIPDGFDRRRDAVVEKYHRKGGLQTWMIEQIAAALDTQPNQLREGYRSLFDELEGRAKPSAPRVPRAVIHVAGQPVSLAPLPWEITPDARHETAPRHRGLIGSRVDRNEPVDHTDRILSALMHHDTLREGRVS